MSPAGISMFYAAADIDTACAEVLATRRKDDERVLTGARWTSTRPMHVLDLTALPEVLSFYARLRYEREELSFPHEFVRNISQPVAPDRREYTEYVPTQILTEYFRHRYRAQDNCRLDGIIGRPAQRWSFRRHFRVAGRPQSVTALQLAQCQSASAPRCCLDSGAIPGVTRVQLQKISVRKHLRRQKQRRMRIGKFEILELWSIRRCWNIWREIPKGRCESSRPEPPFLRMEGRRSP